jgi:hypothetical protein
VVHDTRPGSHLSLGLSPYFQGTIARSLPSSEGTFQLPPARLDLRVSPLLVLLRHCIHDEFNVLPIVM